MGTINSYRSRDIVHMDLDTFFVSVERVLDPALNKRPVIVGGKPLERGVVAGCSYEARSYGVRSAMPLRTAFRLCPEAVFLRGHYVHYAEYSNLATEILTNIAPIVEKSSIDEFYIDLSGCERLKGNTYNWAQQIQHTLNGETRLPLSFGYATNKLVAKVATTEIAKRTSDRHYRVKSGDEQGFFAPMPVRALPGIGAVTEDSLINYGMERLGQIVQTPLRLMTRLFGKTGKVIHEYSQGIDNTDLIPFRECKSISREHTFDEDTFDVTKTFARLHALSTELAEDLRASKVFARKLTVKLRYSDFNTPSKSMKVEPTNNDRLITQSAEKLLRSLWTRRPRIRLVGIEATDFLDDLEQLYLFNADETSPKLDKVLDGIRTKHGNIIHYAIEELR